MRHGTGENRMSMTELAPAGMWRNKISNGGWKSGGEGAFPVTEKATGEVVGTTGCASGADVSAAAAIATDAQRAWAATSGPQRGDILREAARLLDVHRDEIATQIVQETGSIRASEGAAGGEAGDTRDSRRRGASEPANRSYHDLPAYPFKKGGAPARLIRRER